MKYRVQQPYVEAVKVADILVQAKGDGALEPAWLRNAYNDGAVRIEDTRILIGEIVGAGDAYLVNVPNDGPGALLVMSAADFEAAYVSAETPLPEAPADERGDRPPSNLERHAEIGKALCAIGERIKGTPDGNEGPTLYDFGTELIRDGAPA